MEINSWTDWLWQLALGLVITGVIMLWPIKPSKKEW